jgi:glycosyltransferase involved in cell wall biosynthesis
MRTILASVYAVNPYNGSEDGMGWNYVYQIARYQKVVAVTRENNKEPIERYMNENPDSVYENIQFLYYDLPRWARFWKKGSRGAMLYYLLWQRFLPYFVRRAHIPFDIAHNVNFHNDWSPSYLWKFGKPFVWGHIGHHPMIPSGFLRSYKRSYYLKDRATWLVKLLFWNFSPALKTSARKADHILCMNSSVPETLKLASSNYSISPSVASKDFGFDPELRGGKFTLISAGRLVPLKGFDLTIRSFANFLTGLDESSRKNCELLIVGRGPELSTLQNIVKQLHAAENVRFIPWMERAELLKLFRSASAFLFPSHEGAGMVVAEALSFGLPVICLDNYGPGEYINNTCGFKVPCSTYDKTVQDLSEAIYKLHSDPELGRSMRVNARELFLKKFDWNVRGEQFKHVYEYVTQNASKKEQLSDSAFIHHTPQFLSNIRL